MNRWWKRVMLVLSLALAAGCAGGKKAHDGDAAAAELAPAPAYADTAARYNERVAPMDRFWARANVRLTYTDVDGKRREEQPEGMLQIVRPHHLALSLGKAGKTLFWLGCDRERYWWLDLTEEHVAAVGRHEFFEAHGAERIGVSVRPTDMIRLLGIVPLDPSAGGATQWSADGALLGITTPIDGRGVQRMWVDPESMIPHKIELYGQQRELLVVSDLSGRESMAITRPGFGGARPSLPGVIEITERAGGTKIRLTLTGIKDGPITDDAFRFEILRQKFAVQKLINVDAPRVGGGEDNR